MRPQFAETHWPERQETPTPHGVFSGTFVGTHDGLPKESHANEPLTHGPMPASQGPLTVQAVPPLEPPPVTEPPPAEPPPAEP
ncbi:MAG: hypothetical protein Q8N26_32135, partial [Myxococcales bacterium]|nr:hypothetical protein [Myxococcales bacterium]